MRSEQVMELEDTLRGIIITNRNTVTGEPRHANITRMAEAALTRSASYDEDDTESQCGDWPAPCNCDDPETHGGH